MGEPWFQSGTYISINFIPITEKEEEVRTSRRIILHLTEHTQIGQRQKSELIWILSSWKIYEHMWKEIKKKNLNQKNICILSKDFLHKNLSP